VAKEGAASPLLLPARGPAGSSACERGPRAPGLLCSSFRSRCPSAAAGCRCARLNVHPGGTGKPAPSASRSDQRATATVYSRRAELASVRPGHSQHPTRPGRRQQPTRSLRAAPAAGSAPAYGGPEHRVDPTARDRLGGPEHAAAGQRTADRLKTRIDVRVSATAKAATTARLRAAIRVVLCMPQTLCSPVLSPSSP
jgi:hypothetical protein